MKNKISIEIDLEDYEVSKFTLNCDEALPNTVIIGAVSVFAETLFDRLSCKTEKIICESRKGNERETDS